MTGRAEFTDEQIEETIVHALAEGDVQAIPGLLVVLARQNAQRAQEIYDTLLFGIELAQRANAVQALP